MRPTPEPCSCPKADSLLSCHASEAFIIDTKDGLPEVLTTDRTQLTHDWPARRRQDHARQPLARHLASTRARRSARARHHRRRRGPRLPPRAGHRSSIPRPSPQLQRSRRRRRQPPHPPGEVTLAHGGVLFLDELPEFRRNVIEARRPTMESGRAVVVRARERVTMPAKPLVVAAMNPVRVGLHRGDVYG